MSLPNIGGLIAEYNGKQYGFWLLQDMRGTLGGVFKFEDGEWKMVFDSSRAFIEYDENNKEVVVKDFLITPFWPDFNESDIEENGGEDVLLEKFIAFFNEVLKRLIAKETVIETPPANSPLPDKPLDRFNVRFSREYKMEIIDDIPQIVKIQ